MSPTKKPNGDFAEVLMRMTRDQTEALTRMSASQQTIATEVAAASANRVEIAKTLMLVSERLDRVEEEGRTRTQLAVSEVKAHISMEMEAMTTATAAAIKGTATPRMIGWLIAAGALVTSGALTALVLLRTHQ